MKMNFNKLTRLKPISTYLYDIFQLDKVNLQIVNFGKNDILKLWNCVQLCISFNVNDLSI